MSSGAGFPPAEKIPTGIYVQILSHLVISLCLSLSLSLFVCVCVCVCVGVPVALIQLDDQAGVCVAPLSPDLAKRPAFYVCPSLLQNLDMNIPQLVSVNSSASHGVI